RRRHAVTVRARGSAVCLEEAAAVTSSWPTALEETAVVGSTSFRPTAVERRQGERDAVVVTRVADLPAVVGRAGDVEWRDAACSIALRRDDAERPPRTPTLHRDHDSRDAVERLDGELGLCRIGEAPRGWRPVRDDGGDLERVLAVRDECRIHRRKG